ncbi:MAG: hypothetical protein IKZ29_08150 [Clostridiales bacterium]|nr:hypothetical protein [Clostridiales bacterium]
MPWLIKLIMFICVVPAALLMFFIAFPANPSKRKMIFGVRDNPKFHEGDAEARFNSIAGSCRKGALIITVIVCIMSIVLLFLPTNGMTMLAWILLVYGLFLVAVPFGKGNVELKNLKKELGITKSGVTYTDLTNTNTIHSLKLPWLILPNAIAFITAAVSFLIDLGVIKVDVACEQYALTMMGLSFLFIAVILIPIAIMMDNTRNIVISKDSNINANYNRAKKKTWADLMVSMSWANALFLVGYSILLMFVNSEIVVLCGVLIYTVIIMVIVGIGAFNQKSIEKRYARDTELELLDDDDYWVFGMFYNNPNDTRLNVEKRFGYGGTINVAHPAGKVIMVITFLLLVGMLIFVAYLAATGQMNDLKAGINIPGLTN